MAHTMIILTAKSYAKLHKISMSTTYRRLAVMVQQSRAKKIGGKWAIPLNRIEIRAYRRAMVEEIRRLGAAIKNSPWNKPITHLTARRAVCNEMLVMLGSSDILVELDRARCNAGIQTPKSRQQYRAALEAIERMIAA